MSSTFRGRRFHVDTTGVEGMCIHEGVEKAEIIVPDSLKGLKHLRIAIHEATHAFFEHMPEEEVARYANDVGRFLWKLGYRRKGGVA